MVEFKNWWISYWLAPFSWSKWSDISTFSYGYKSYLLQGRVNRKTNAKKFKVTPIKNKYGTVGVETMKMERLVECGLIDEIAK